MVRAVVVRLSYMTVVYGICNSLSNKANFAASVRPPTDEKLSASGAF